MKTLTLSTMLMALTLMIWGCSDGDDSLKTTGKLNVFLVDAPFPTDQVAAANVTIFKVEARLTDAESQEDSESMENGDSKGGFITLMDTPTGEINLLELINGAYKQLADVEIPTGTYDLIRVYVTGVNVVLSEEAGGETYDLKVPSGAQSGIKVFLDPPLQVAGGLSEDLILDFDVSKSFVPKGGGINNPDAINGFNFTPVIRASITSTTGSAVGKVLTEGEEGLEPLVGATVTLYNLDNTEAGGTITDEDGGYTISVAPGIYRLEVSKSEFETQSVNGIEVILSNKTTLEDIVLVAETKTTTDG